MLAYTVKEILNLIPEALPMIKSASLEQDFPLDSKDSTLATALQLKYFEKVAYHPVAFNDMEKIALAVELYGLKDIVLDLSSKMVKAAEAKKLATEINPLDDYRIKEAALNHDYGSTAQRSSIATELYKQASELGITPSDEVILYSGHGFLNKEAAIKSLTVRFDATQDKNFVKVATAIVRDKDSAHLTHPESLVKIANMVSDFDTDNKLNLKGFNFYKEAFFVKEAAYKSALMVKLAGKQVPYESIERVGRGHISSYLGADVAKEMTKGASHFKSVVETLPMDMQQILSNLIKNI
jgi:hypothetical protein